MVLIAATAALFGLSKAADYLPTSEDTTLPGVTRALAGGLFLIAGALHLVRWRLTAQRRAARAATVLIVLGAALATLPLVGSMLQQSPELDRSAPAARLLFVVPLLVLLALREHPRRPRDGNGHPLAVTATLLVGWLAVSVTAGQLRLPHAVMANPAVWQVAEYTVCLGWAALAVRTWRDSGSARRPVDALVTCGLLLMAACEAAKAMTMAQAPGGFVISLELQLMVAVIAVCVAGTELREAVDTDAARTGTLALSLLQARTELAHTERKQQERIHDARSAVAGLVGAARLLAEPADGLDTVRLHGLMTEELGRLQNSLSGDALEPITTFDLGAALHSVIAGHRLAGGVARADLDVVRVIGRPAATATAVANLLANVRHHAPGAQVELRTEHSGSSVLLIVEDDGPGIPAAERSVVTGRGVRGSTTGPGSGLGLYTAAAALAAQAGSLQLGSRPGGGTRVVLTFRCADSPSTLDVPAPAAVS